MGQTADAPPQVSKCFVVMPFGIKPLGDGTQRTYDFDKVYRVVMQRAIRQAGMEPIRADESVGSQIIHTEMFKDLRDQPVVLADLSLSNPNVFYELGIRHVMAHAGTVLMCQEDSQLPFDVRLSRCIFYKYDGQSLDWEEAERLVEKLQVALQQARKGEPDSPVHALLETVIREEHFLAKGQIIATVAEREPEDLEVYQQIVATHWQRSDYSIQELLSQNCKSLFGVRTLGLYCLREENLPAQANEVARLLYDTEQYDLANSLYEILNKDNRCNELQLLIYASSYSEEDRTVAGAIKALSIIDDAREIIIKKFKLSAINDSVSKGTKAKDLAYSRAEYFHSLAGLMRWKAWLTNDDEDIKEAFHIEQDAIKYISEARDQRVFGKAGFLARSYLRMMLTLRTNKYELKDLDPEVYHESILNIKTLPNDTPIDRSFLNWYQAIALADAGDSELAKRKVIRTYAEDAKLIAESDHMANWQSGTMEIGKRQYAVIRRFIEQNASVLRNPTLIGMISQYLQIGHQ